MGFLSLAQTNVISSKDHSLSVSNVLQEPDNFGGPAIMPIRRKKVKIVEYIGEGCIAEHYYISEFNPFDYQLIDEFEIDSTISSNSTGNSRELSPLLTVDTICEYGVFSRELTPRIKNIYGLDVEYKGFMEPAKTNHFFDGMKRSTRSGISWFLGVLLLIIIVLNLKKFHFLVVFMGISILAAYGQTNVISAKDHSVGLENALLETDNFGEPPNKHYIDTLEYIGNNRFVVHHKIAFWNDENYSSFYTDTIIDENNDGILSSQYRLIYGDIIFLNFTQPIQKNELRRTRKQNSIPWFIGTFLVAITAMFIVNKHYNY